MPGQDAVVPAPDSAPAAKAGIRGFIASPGGKVVVIGAALATLLVVLGAVAAIVLLTLGTQVDTVASNSNAPGGSAPAPRAVSATASAEATEETAPVIPVTNRDVFMERDPFEPVIEPTKTVDASAAPDPASQQDTLTLQGVLDQDGVSHAVLTFNGTTYTAAAGERLGDTAWQVLSVGKTSATMLFGDVQVTLTLGEGVAK